MKNKIEFIDDKVVFSGKSPKPDFKQVMDRYSSYQSMLRKYLFVGGSALVAVIGFLAYQFVTPIHSQKNHKADSYSQPELMYPVRNLEVMPPSIPLLEELDKKSILSNERSSRQVASEPVEPQSIKEPKSKVEKEHRDFLISKNAKPIEGFDRLYEYFAKELSHPRRPQGNVEGIVLVSFVVMSDSSIQRIEIKKPLGDYFDAEAIRLVQNMPKWKPAVKNGKATDQSLTIPVNFIKVTDKNADD